MRRAFYEVEEDSFNNPKCCNSCDEMIRYWRTETNQEGAKML